MRWICLFFLALTGCEIEPVEIVDGSVPEGETALTWYGDVGPVLVEHCGSCHQTGGFAPFTMESYDDIYPMIGQIMASIEDGSMPPWASKDTEACTPDVPFADNPQLNEAEKQLVRDWIEQGAREGTPTEIPLPSTGDLEDPTAVVSLREPFAVSGDRDIYQCFRIEVPHDTDVYIQDMQVLPDNGAVVHHVLVWNDPENKSADLAGPDGSYRCTGEPGFFPTDLIGGWAPGQPVVSNPENTGTLFKAGSSIVVNVHYHPTEDTTEYDQTEIALKWTTTKPPMYVTYYLVDLPFGADSDDDGFYIPAGAGDHTEVLTFDPYRYLPDAFHIDLPMFAVMPHMHYRGKNMRVTLDRAEGGKSCLINAEDYRFDFQNTYYYEHEPFDTLLEAAEQLPTMHAGDIMKIRCTYDNSWNNPFMGEALAATGDADVVDVRWGEETGDEMCMAVVGLVIPPIDITGLF